MLNLRSGLLTLTLSVLAGLPAFAQQGGISGMVRDGSGAAVPGATVTITNQETNTSSVATTSADGTYAATGLDPGLYTVTVELKGLGKATQKDLRLAAGATVAANLMLEARLSEELTVTGTRFGERVATQTPAPVDILDAAALRSTGSTETGKILQFLEPAFNFSTTFVSDGTDIIRPATLRSLSPDDTLVLVNGKRRHQQSLINIQQTIARGSAGYDINTIPASALERVEVLRDGAAAQYGSDAIAGVINFILKKNTRATDLTLELGQFYDENPELPLGASPNGGGGHGSNFMGAINTGFGFGRDGFLNFTAEYRDRNQTNRAGPDSLRVDPARVDQRLGDPDANDFLAWLNSAFPMGKGSLYLFGGYSYRTGNSSGFFRSQGDGRTVPALYPNGFLPTIATQPTDWSGTLGYRAPFKKDWTWDLSASYGNSQFQFREENTVNVSYWYEPTNPANPNGPRFNASPTEADTGNLGYDQVNFNLDFAGPIHWDIGAGPLNLAVGTEWRQEGYKITPGEPVSYQYGRTNNRAIQIFNQNGGIAAPGSQGFPGFNTDNAVDETRNNFSLYVDLESQLSKKFLGGAAVRYEHYSDFGSKVTAKAALRFNFTDRFALRATVSNGFRAPGVQQAFFSLRSTNLNAQGVLTDTLTARNDSAVTRAFGIPSLQEETSLNFAGGVVTQPFKNFRLTVDAYSIGIDNRIVFSSNIQPEDISTCGTPFNPTLCPITAILAVAAPGTGQVQFFTNAIDTTTSGVDIVALYDWRLGPDSVLTFQAALNFNKTVVDSITSSSSILPPSVLFDNSQVTLVERGQPQQHFILGATYRKGGWSANISANYFGEVAGEGFTPGFVQVWGGKWLTDLQFTLPMLKDKLSVTLGAANLFNVYPDNWDPVNAFPFPQLGFVYGWETMPFGMNGGYYYGRVNFRLNH